MVRRAKVATISDATKAQIRAAHEAGRASEKYNTSESRYITVEGNSKLTLILPDGRTTLYGAFYYRELLKTEPIELYAMETPLINDKWVMGYSGKKILVRRRGADGQWNPTKAGLQYFKLSREEFVITVGAYVVARDQVWPLPPVTLSRKNFTVPFIANPEATLKLRRLNTQAEQVEFVKTQVYAYLDDLSVVQAADREWPLLFYDSMPIVWDGLKENITYSRTKMQFDNNGDAGASNETILNRPLLDYTIPDACARPFDLHANCLKRLGSGCGVQMIFDCFILKKNSSGAAKRNGAPSTVYSHGATIPEIEADMDIIFGDLGYEEGEYPFEHSWRRDGITPKMILLYCERKSIRCFVHHKGNKIQAHIPAGRPGPTINFLVFNDHAYWFGRSLEEHGLDRRPAACNSASQMALCSETPTDRYSDKELGKVFITQQSPPYEEWLDMTEMIHNLLHNQAAYRHDPAGKTARADHVKKRLFFCNTWIRAERYVSFAACLERSSWQPCSCCRAPRHPSLSGCCTELLPTWRSGRF